MGDTIFYDKRTGEGRAYSNVHLSDSANQISLYGNFVYYKEEGDVALAYDSALMVEYSSPDTVYLNADTLYAYAVDSTDKVVRAFHHVRIFRVDVPGGVRLGEFRNARLGHSPDAVACGVVGRAANHG